MKRISLARLCEYVGECMKIMITIDDSLYKKIRSYGESQGLRPSTMIRVMVMSWAKTHLKMEEFDEKRKR
jgi:hypothetical protein